MQIAGLTGSDLRRETFTLPQVQRADLLRILRALGLVGGVTLCLLIPENFQHLTNVTIVYLVPVLIAAAWWGVAPAITAAVGGIAASTFFFYPPLYDFHIESPQHAVDLILFVCVAVVTGRLADSARRNLETAEQREQEVRSLYAFSRRLASASATGDILSAIREHLGSVLGRRVLLFESGASPIPGDRLPESLRSVISQIAAGKSDGRRVHYVDDERGSAWLVRAVSDSHSIFGTVAIEVGRDAANASNAIRERVNIALRDATAPLERLDVARAIEEAKARTKMETFREALIGSVSHELRTPLASIIGSASVLSQATAITHDERLAGLTAVIRDEAERLNSDIQNLLDASRISSTGVHAQLVWSDPADLIDAAVERHRRRLSARRFDIRLQDDLPLVHVDPVLVVQALRQVIDNAAKYSPPDSTIAIVAKGEGACVSIRVEDRGMGLTADEKAQLFQRFHRNPRHQATAAGSGLGLWIARAFVVVCGGTIAVDSAGPGQGATVTMELPAPPHAASNDQGNSDE
jgi:two-component system sensor histidine kinase KdpD